jgi:hypothetical protein
MQYLLLIHEDEKSYWGLSDDDRKALNGEYGSYTEALRSSGAMVGGAQLQPTSSATSVRVKDGDTVVTDGPFAETKEQLGGYYLIDAESIDEAIDWAAKIPAARTGTIEVRPLVPMQVPAS